MLFAWSSLLLMLAGHSLAAAPTTCYNQDGSIANNRYKPCPGTTYCCDSGDTCTTNGLCQQRNNHYPNMEQVAWWYDAKANRTSYGDFTFLYTASTCTNANFSGCSTRCTNANTPSYLWACNDDALTNYCCYDPSKSLGLWEHQSCCKYPGAVFQLDKPSIIAWNSTSASTPVSTSSASSALQSSTTPATSGVSNTTAGNGPTPGMSQGTTIGISVGVAVGVFLCLLLLAILFWRVQALRNLLRRDKSLQDQNQVREYEPIPADFRHEKSTIFTNSSPVSSFSPMSPPTPSAPVELHAIARPHEMPHNNTRMELP